MKFTIQAGVLLDGLKSVQARARGGAGGIEILRHIRTEVAGDRVLLLGHDLESCSEAVLGVDDSSDGACALPADALVRLVSGLLKAAHVTAEIAGHQIAIKAGRSRYKLPILSADDFPSALPCEGISIDLSAGDVENLFGRSREALDPKYQQSFGMGAYLHLQDGVVSSAATDGKRFAKFASTVRMPELTPVIVPMTALDEIARLGGNGGRLTLSTNTVRFDAGGRSYRSKLIDATFPPYQTMMPKLVENYAELDREELLAAVQRLTSISEEASQIDMTIGGGELALVMEGLSEGAESVACSADLPDVLISVSPLQLLTSLKMLRGEVVQLHVEKNARGIRLLDPNEPETMVVQATRVPKHANAKVAA